MFEWALRANLPIIGVQTDDPANFPMILQLIAEGQPKHMPTKLSASAMGTHTLWWTEDSTLVDRELYLKFLGNEAKGIPSRQLVVCNFDASNPYIFDAGTMPTPPAVIENFLKGMTDDVAGIMPCLSGMSLKVASEAVLITEARTGALTVPELRKTRTMLTTSVTGLTALDATFDFYDMSEQMEQWLELNTPFFFASPHHKLVPRGLMFSGPPGTGKSMVAKVIAHQWDVPLYHLDISSVLTKFVGASEARLRDILNTLDREEPCVVLIDEVEKVINTSEDAGVVARMLSQLLWWLHEHRSRVFTVMTTNDLESIPAELYRPGRMDAVMEVKSLTKESAVPFAFMVYESVMGVVPSDIHKAVIKEVLSAISGGLVSQLYSHANISNVVYQQIKKNGWLAIDKPVGAGV